MAAAPDDEQVINQVRVLTDPGEKEHGNRVRRYDHAYDVYRALSPNKTGVESWQSKLRVKYALQVIDTNLVNIVTGFPRVIVTPRGPEDELGAKGMQAVLDYQLREDHLVERQPVFAQQGLIYGVTTAKNHWLYRTRQQNSREFTRDELTGRALPQKVTREIVDRDGPTFEPTSVYYTFWDPNAPDVDSCQYVAFDFWLSPNQLREQAYDPETGRGLYHNVEQVLAQGDRASKQPEQTAQERFLGSGEYKRKNLVHLRETWWRNNGEVWVTVVGNGHVLHRHQPSPFWHGEIPAVIAQPRPDLFELQGIPETELVDHIQDALHTLQNMTIDNLHMTVMRGVTYREGGVTDPNAIVLRPRFKWAVVDHDDIRPFDITPLSSDVFTERQRLLSDMQLVTGVNPYVSGSDMSTIDQNTATGVTALQEVASRLLRFKASMLQYKGYQRTYEMWGSMIQQFMDAKVAVQIIGENGQEEWKNIHPEDVIGNYNYILEGSEESLSRQQERGESIALWNALAPLIQAGIIDPKPLVEKLGAAYGFRNPDGLLKQQPQLPPAAPAPGYQQNGVQPNPGLNGPLQQQPGLTNALATTRQQ